MRKTMIAVAVAVMVLVIPAVLQAEMNAGMSVNDKGISSFYIALGDYNRVQQQNVIDVKNQGISDEELPVVFYLASKAKVSYKNIVNLRLKEWSWARIAKKYSLAPSVFNVPVQGQAESNAYGRLYRNFRVNPKVGWNKVDLKDDDIVNSVNLRLMSDYYGYSPEEVIRMRDEGRDFIEINNEVNHVNMKKGWHSRYGLPEGSDEAAEFYSALAEYSMVRPWEVAQVKKLGITDEELPVVFFIASNAGVPYNDIVKLRLKRWNWMRIAKKYELDPGLFFVPLKERADGRVFGGVYGYYSQVPQERWGRIKLADDEIINLVNLRFVSDYYGYAPDEVVRMRESGRDYITISNDIHVITSRQNWGHDEKQYREKHNRDYRYDKNYKGNNLNKDRNADELGTINLGGQKNNYKDLDDRNSNGQNNKQGMNDNGNGNRNGNNNYGNQNNNAQSQNSGNQNNNAQNTGNQAVNTPVPQAPSGQLPLVKAKGFGTWGRNNNATPPAAQTAVVQAQPTQAPSTAAQVTATAGQDQGSNGQGRDDNGSNGKGNNGVRNHGAGNDNGAGNDKHINQ